MPDAKQNKVEVPVTTFGVGSSDTGDLKKIFPASPLYNGELDDNMVDEEGKRLVDGNVNDGGHWGYGEQSLDYDGAPNLADVETGGGGKPGSPHAPNIVSPTELGQNPADIPDAGAEVTQRMQGGGDPFPGDGLVSPSKTSKVVSEQKIGEFLKSNKLSRKY